MSFISISLVFLIIIIGGIIILFLHKNFDLKDLSCFGLCFKDPCQLDEDSRMLVYVPKKCESQLQEEEDPEIILEVL